MKGSSWEASDKTHGGDRNSDDFNGSETSVDLPRHISAARGLRHWIESSRRNSWMTDRLFQHEDLI